VDNRGAARILTGGRHLCWKTPSNFKYYSIFLFEGKEWKYIQSSPWLRPWWIIFQTFLQHSTKKMFMCCRILNLQKLSDLSRELLRGIRKIKKKLNNKGKLINDKYWTLMLEGCVNFWDVNFIDIFWWIFFKYLPFYLYFQEKRIKGRKRIWKIF